MKGEPRFPMPTSPIGVFQIVSYCTRIAVPEPGYSPKSAEGFWYPHLHCKLCGGAKLLSDGGLVSWMNLHRECQKQWRRQHEKMAEDYR